MPQDTKMLIKELSEYERIEELPGRKQNYALQILEKIEENQDKHPQGVPAGKLRDLICDQGMGNKTYYAFKSWLKEKGYIKEQTVGTKGRGRPKKIIYITAKGHEIINRSRDVGKLTEEVRKFYATEEKSQRTNSLREIFKTIFIIAYEEFKEGKPNDYIEFLKSIEIPIRDYLNKDIVGKIDKIRNGIDVGDYEDPYFIIDRIGLSALYYDAKLAKRMGHFLTPNHMYVLIKANEYTEEELIRHNKEWARRFEEEEAKGEEEPNAPLWRLNPYLFVVHEREIREKIYGGRFKAYYDQLRERTYSRNGFQHDSRWPIDINRAALNFEKRVLERKAKKYGLNKETYLKLNKMIRIAKLEYILEPDGSLKVRCYDEKTGKLIEEFSLKKHEESSINSKVQ